MEVVIDGLLYLCFYAMEKLNKSIKVKSFRCTRVICKDAYMLFPVAMCLLWEIFTGE